MHFQTVLLTASSLVAGTFAACKTPTVRRDWATLSQEERTHFIDVQQQLWRQDVDSKGLSVYDRNFTLLHRDNTPYAHIVPTFLPWHRRFLRDYEAALRTIDPDISLPYWNWANDHLALNESILWDPTTFGGNGQGADYCVQDGKFANWTLALGGNFTDVNKDITHCLRRIWSRGLNVPVPAGKGPYAPSMAEVGGNISLAGDNYDTFRHWLEPWHGAIHQGVGGFSIDLQGDMTPVENSPNEPVFWMHHCFIDRIWWQYQQQSDKAKTSYGGFPNTISSLPKNDSMWTNGAHLTDLMPPWKVPVETAMYTDADDYCYTYDDA